MASFWLRVGRGLELLAGTYHVQVTVDRQPGMGFPQGAAHTAQRSGRTCVQKECQSHSPQPSQPDEGALTWGAFSHVYGDSAVGLVMMPCREEPVWGSGLWALGSTQWMLEVELPQRRYYPFSSSGLLYPANHLMLPTQGPRLEWAECFHLAWPLLFQL